MKIFLTGGTGFIGRRLLGLLNQSTHEVLILVRPQCAVQQNSNPRIQWITGTLDDVASYRSALDQFQPEGCIHLAWYTDPADYLTSEDANLHQLEASLQLLRTLKRVHCRRFVAAGTCVEYALTSPEQLQEDSPTRPSTIYAAAKLASYHLSERICDTSEISFAWGRIFHVYGPGENPNRLVPATIRTLLSGKDFLASPGDQVRDYLHVDDIASAFLRLAEAKGTGVFNICSNLPITIRHLLSRIEELCGSDGRICFGAKKYHPHDPMFICGCNRRLSALGWRPGMDLETGLRLTIEGLRQPIGGGLG
jgi:nucleoside-diphosphate-sugar epimerase